MIRGATQYNPVSRFIREIPAELMDDKPPVQKRRDYQEYAEDSRERGLFRAKPFGGGVSLAGQGARETVEGRFYRAEDSQTEGYGKDTPYRRIADTEFDKPISGSGAGMATRQPFASSFGKSYDGQAVTVSGKPKAIVRPKRTAIENQPYISKAAQSVGAVTIEAAGNKSLEYGVGDRVRHMRYGEGTVLKIEAGPRDSQVTVIFDEAGQKIMYAGFAKLKKV